MHYYFANSVRILRQKIHIMISNLRHDIDENIMRMLGQYVKLDCTVGWVDIGTRARVPLRLVVYLKKVGKMTKN
jgi:hypothetical protein